MSWKGIRQQIENKAAFCVLVVVSFEWRFVGDSVLMKKSRALEVSRLWSTALHSQEEKD